MSTDVVSTAGSPSAKRSSGKWATLSTWPPDDSNSIVVPTRRWMSRSAPFVSASNARACACIPAMSASIAVDRRDSPSCPSTTLAKSETSSGAEPRVIKGSVRALVKPSRCAQEIQCASIARVPRVCWNCDSALHLRWNTESVAGWKG